MSNLNAFWRGKGLLFMALVVVGAAGLTSCATSDDDNTVNPQGTYQTISDLFNNSVNTNAADYSLLNAAVARAGLRDSLNRASITVFAPTDAAFRAAGYADVNAINAAPIADLQRILRYHIVGRRVPPSDFEASGNTSAATLGNSTLYINRLTNGNVYVNNARILETRTTANNGVLYLVDKVLMAPVGNLLQVAAANPNLSLLVAAARRGGQAVLNALSTGTNPITVFAPTNAAFQAAGYADTTAINRANAATLASIIQYHVINGRVFSPLLQTGSNVTTLQGGTAAVGTANNVMTITGRGNNNTAANITGPDIMATNGVIHIIDRVLLPGS